MGVCSLIGNLGSEEVLEDAEVVDLELDDEGLFLMQAEAGEVGNRGRLVEHVQVAQGELLLHWLLNLEQGCVLALLRAIVVAQLH